MKKLIVFVLAVVLFGSCTVTHYSGEIYPNKVEFNKANFKYLKTIKGSATAKYNSYGWDRNKADGLINEAKSNMYLNHSFQPNQVVANITKDILRVTDTKGFGSREIKVIVTGDIFEFSENGIYYDNQGTNQSSKPLVRIYEQKEVELLNIVKKGFTDFSEDVKLKKGIKVLFNLGDKYYKALVNYKDFGKVNLKGIEVFNVETKIWTSFERDNVTVPNNTIIGYKL